MSNKSTVLGIDIGGTSSKVVILKKNAPPKFLVCNTTPDDIKSLLTRYAATRHWCITGCGSVEVQKNLSKFPFPPKILFELDANAIGCTHFFKHPEFADIYGTINNFDRFLVVTLGTAASFAIFEGEGKVTRTPHIPLSACSLAGFGNILCGVQSGKDLSLLAMSGDSHKIDKYAETQDRQQLLGSFGQILDNTVDPTKADLADSLLNLLCYWVSHITFFITKKYNLDTVVFVGGICETGGFIQRKIMAALEQMNLRHLTCVFPKKPSFIGAFGAAFSVFDNEEESNLFHFSTEGIVEAPGKFCSFL